MQVRYFKEFSNYLNRDMEFKIYGHDGPMCLVIPCQDGRFFEWEDRGMFHLVEDLIDQGKIQFVTVDTVDKDTWSSHGESSWRMAHQENWVNYLMNELIPSALAKAGQSGDAKMMVTGASMGATHATNLFLRFPDRFDKILAMSGIYDMSPYIYDGNFDGNFYQNNPLSYLPNMDTGHDYINKYNQARGAIVVGQGAWENECLNDTRRLADVFYQKGIHLPVYFWGQDTPHDWPSWEKQFSQYMREIVQ